MSWICNRRRTRSSIVVATLGVPSVAPLSLSDPYTKSMMSLDAAGTAGALVLDACFLPAAVVADAITGMVASVAMVVPALCTPLMISPIMDESWYCDRNTGC